MMKFRYLIIGGGMAAANAVKGIRELDRDGSIGIVGLESDPPYARPPLSKKLWQGKPVQSIWLDTDEAELFPGRRVEAINPGEKWVRDTHDTVYGYDKALLATGGTPHRFIPGEDIIYFRTLAHYRELKELTERGNRFAVIGGGFIGSEIAAALNMAGKEVTLIFPEEGICSRVFPTPVSAFLNGYYREKGVRVMPGETVDRVERRGSTVVATTRRGEVAVDGVVAGLGIRLNLDLAAQAGCAISAGVEVNEYLQALAPDVYAAGDIASYPSPQLGKRVRFEHEDNAVTMGKHAGRNMAGANEPYRHLPYFYSDLFDLGYEAVGELDSRMETMADWEEPYRKGVLYYLEAGKVRGVLLWNVWDRVEAARRLITEQETVTAGELKGRISS